jgi:two-component system KDP operon response regulator KdpE
MSPHLRFAVEDVRFDVNARTASRGGEPVSLTPTEWRLLERLAHDAGRLVLNAELLTDVWGARHRDDVQYLRVWISRLRRKLEPHPAEQRLIKTMQGIGYMLDAKPLADS